MFVNALTEGRTFGLEDTALGSIYTENIRFRVQSMFKSPFDYGYICAATLILHLHGWRRHLEGTRAFIIVLLCCSFGILTCGCRIVWIGAVLSIACYSIWVFHLSRSMTYGIIAMILLIMSYFTIPAVEDKVNKITDIFVEDSETVGSSIQMRMSQFLYVRYYIEGDEWFGLGKGYWNSSYAEEQRIIEGLLGVESVILSYLLERGIVGLTLWTTFYAIIFRYFWKNRKKSKALTGLGCSILILYLLFSIGTGELGSVYPTMLLFGFTAKAIEAKKNIKNNA